MAGAAPGQVATAAPGAATPETGPATAAAPASLRVRVETPRLRGSINLVGARIDDIVMRDYRETVDPTSPAVRLFSPRGSERPFFAQFGWTVRPAAAGQPAVRVPGVDTVWQTSSTALTPGRPVTLSWDNGQGQLFELVFSIDENYMFTVEQRVTNAADGTVVAVPWSRIRREHTPATSGYVVLHEGFVGVLDGRLRETTYKSAKDDAAKRPGQAALEVASQGGWLGFTDTYWLAAILPVQNQQVQAAFRYLPENGADRYQVDYLSPPQEARTGQVSLARSHLFAGAKEVSLLDRYEAQLGIGSFDKAVDFGWFYFITKPMFYVLEFLFHILGNFGLAILVLTLLVKGLFFPLANKSYRSMSKMKALAPEMEKLKQRFENDRAMLQQEMMALYKREGVNPLSGCLPMIIQIPVFFALYKVLLVSIEMRHAPFFGWILDLTAQDPTNIFTLFGLIPFDPTVIPMIGPFLHLGIWPLIMGVTMWLQQSLNPAPPDPTQAKVFALMPFIFTFMLASFPAGLVIYWAWNNLLSIAQQRWIMYRMGVKPT